VFFSFGGTVSSPGMVAFGGFKNGFRYFFALFSVFLRLAVIFCYKFVRWWQGKNQNFKKSCVIADKGKVICGYGYHINKKHPRPFYADGIQVGGCSLL